MNDKLKITIAVTCVAIVAYSIGYTRAQKRLIEDFGGAASKEALIYLATQDHIRNRYGR